MQNIIDMIKNLKGTGEVEVNNLTQLFTFKESLGKEKRYFIAGMDKKPTSRTKDNDFSKKKYLVVDLDIRKDYKEANDVLLDDDALMEEIAKTIEKIEDSGYNDYSYVVHSGNGIHIYYVGDEIEFTPEEYREGCQHFYNLLNEVIDYEPDSACKNIARVSRLPGSVNSRAKFGIEPITVEILIEQPQVSKRFNKLKEFAKEATQEVEIEKKVYTDVIHQGRGVSDDSKFDEYNAVDIVDIVTRHYGCQALRKDSQVTALRENNENMGLYVYHPTNSVVASGSSITSKLVSQRNKYNAFSFVMHEIYGGNFEKAKEYFLLNYGIKRKEKGEIPKKKHYNIKGYEYPSKAFKKFDCLMSGEFCVIVAGPNSGKTTFALGIIQENAKLGKLGYYMNLEFDIKNVPTHMRLNKHGKTKRNLTDLEPLTEEEQYSLDSYVKRYLEQFDYYNSPNGEDIDDLIEKLLDLNKQGRDLVVIDSLSGIRMGSEQNRKKIEDYVAEKLMRLCEATGMTIILLHHTNKKGEHSGSQKIKDWSRVFIFIERDFSPFSEALTTFTLTKDKFVNVEEINVQYENGEYVLPVGSLYNDK